MLLTVCGRRREEKNNGGAPRFAGHEIRRRKSPLSPFGFRQAGEGGTGKKRGVGKMPRKSRRKRPYGVKFSRKKVRPEQIYFVNLTG